MLSAVSAGKKTFNSLLGRAKDKYAQVQQQRAEQVQLQQQGITSTGGENREASSSTGGSGGKVNIGGYTIPAPWQGGMKLEDVKNNLSSNINDLKARFAKPNPQREELKYENPGVRESFVRDYSQSPPPSTRSLAGQSGRDKPLPGTDPVSMGTPNAGATYQGYSASPTTGSQLANSSSPSRTALGSSPAKVQMLPRQTISLLDHTSTSREPGRPSAAGSRRDDGDDSDSDVEYVRNPFNDDD